MVVWRHYSVIIVSQVVPLEENVAPFPLPLSFLFLLHVGEREENSQFFVFVLFCNIFFLFT